MDAFRRHKLDWIVVPRNSDFVWNVVAAVSPTTGVRESDQGIVASQDDRLFSVTRKKDGN